MDQNLVLTPAQTQQALALCHQLEALLSPPTVQTGTAIIVSGGDLQAAIDAARPGDTIILQAGATYTGNFVLPAKTGDAVITLLTSGTLPDGRVRPADAVQMPKLAPAPGGLPVIATAPGAHHYALVGLEILPLAGGANDQIRLGDGSSAQNTLDNLPHDLVIDRCYIHGDPTTGQKRGIALNCGVATISNCYISDIFAPGQDSQAICGWNGPGPYTIENNYLEAASENVLFGGADPAIPNLVPSYITITGNLISKPLAWMQKAGLNVKNAIELKNAAHVRIEGNVVERVWADPTGQEGYLLVLTVRNQDGSAPWCTVEDVQVVGNVFRHGGAFVNILAVDDTHPSARAAGLVFTGNLVYDIDPSVWVIPGGSASGRMIELLDGPNGMQFDHNTFLGAHLNSLFTFQNGQFPIAGFIYAENMAMSGEYGLVGAGDLLGMGVAMLAHYAPGYQWMDNAITGAVTGTYPDGTATDVLMNPDYSPIAFSGGANIAGLKAALPGLDLTQ